MIGTSEKINQIEHMCKIILNNRKPDASLSTAHITKSAKLVSSSKQTSEENVTPLSTPICQDNNAVKLPKHSKIHDTGDPNQLPSPLKESNST